mgnify:CR=1 FL=1
MPKKPKWIVSKEPGRDPFTDQPDSIEIRDTTTDNHDVVARVPLIGDEEYDRDVAAVNAELIAGLPELIETCTAVLDLLEAEGRDTGQGGPLSDLRDLIDPPT